MKVTGYPITVVPLGGDSMMGAAAGGLADPSAGKDEGGVAGGAPPWVPLTTLDVVLAGLQP